MNYRDSKQMPLGVCLAYLDAAELDGQDRADELYRSGRLHEIAKRDSKRQR